MWSEVDPAAKQTTWLVYVHGGLLSQSRECCDGIQAR